MMCRLNSAQIPDRRRLPPSRKAGQPSAPSWWSGKPSRIRIHRDVELRAGIAAIALEFQFADRPPIADHAQEQLLPPGLGRIAGIDLGGPGRVPLGIAGQLPPRTEEVIDAPGIGLLRAHRQGTLPSLRS